MRVNRAQAITILAALTLLTLGYMLGVHLTQAVDAHMDAAAQRSIEVMEE